MTYAYVLYNKLERRQARRRPGRGSKRNGERG